MRPDAPRHRWIALVPNTLSVGRLLMAIAFPFVPGSWRLATVLAAGISDWLDGQIARRFGATSVAGGLLDGISDKLFTFSVLVTLVVEGRLHWALALLVLLRDLAVASTAAYAAATGQWSRFGDMVPRFTGKLTTVFFFLWASTVFIESAAAARLPLYVLTAGCSIAAAVEYLARFVAALERQRKDRTTSSSSDKALGKDGSHD